MTIIFLDGESKGGKTAVGKHLKHTLQLDGRAVRLIVAGNFFRTVTLLSLRRIGGIADDSELESTVVNVLKSAELYDEFTDEELQSNEVDALVSRVGMLDVVQEAAVGWRIGAAQKALDDDVEVLLFDGRNLRAKLRDWVQRTGITVALELIIYCRPEVAADRYLRDEGSESPTAPELEQATAMISERREMDRDRKEAAYTDSIEPVILRAGAVSAASAVADAFDPAVSLPPRPILFDNSDVSLEGGLATTQALLLAALEKAK